MLNTKLLMTTSSIFYGLIGIALIFLSDEISQFLHTAGNQMTLLIFQILGAVYFGFAMLNWMTKSNLIGGIYSRPLVIGNLAHFLISTFALMKSLNHTENLFGIILVLTFIYTAFTLLFGYIFMVNPRKIVEDD